MQADKVLLVDTGNTCIKYRWLTDTSEQVQVADTIDVLVNRLSKAPVLKIYLSNVGNDDAETQLQLFCQSVRAQTSPSLRRRLEQTMS